MCRLSRTPVHSGSILALDGAVPLGGLIVDVYF